MKALIVPSLAKDHKINYKQLEYIMDLTNLTVKPSNNHWYALVQVNVLSILFTIKDVNSDDRNLYCSMVGALQYFHALPAITVAVNTTSQHVHTPNSSHFIGTKEYLALYCKKS